ncbi:MAG: alpha/beta fold hydrolase [Acidimicrobiales bacterium]
MPYPPGLHVVDRAPTAAPVADGRSAPTVVLVHGSLDRADSFRRAVRRLADLRLVTYDRRGYHRSRRGGVTDLAGHVDDLVALVDACAGGGPPPVVIGHSFGGTVAVGAALAAPDRIGAVGAWEPPMRWLGFQPRRRSEPPGTAEEEVLAFVDRMVGEGAWERLGARGRAERLADGPALLADLAALRAPAAPFEVTALRVPAVFGRGGRASRPHHRATVEWLASHVPGAERFDVEAAGHGVHLSAPDAFGAFVRRTVAAARPLSPAVEGRR